MIEKDIGESEVPKKYDSFIDFKPLIDDLPEYPTREQITEIILKFPPRNPELKKYVFDSIAGKTKLTLANLEERYSILHPKSRRRPIIDIDKRVNEYIERLKERNPDDIYIHYYTNHVHYIIEINNKEINLIELNIQADKITENTPEPIYNNSLKILYMVKDERKRNRELFTIKTKGKVYRNITPSGFINSFKDNIPNHNIGFRVMRRVFLEL